MVEVTDSEALRGDVEVVSSNPAQVINMFLALTGIAYLLYLLIPVFIINLYQFLILYSSKVLVFEIKKIL